jgi:excisionase family DNA binding protein
MECLTLETLPKAFSQLTNEVSEIRQMLLAISNDKPAEADRWLNLDELCQYHPDKPSRNTVYGWTQAGIIPVHKGGKKLRFLKSEIDRWLLQGRKQSTAEIEAESKTERDTYLLTKRKGGKL